VRFDSLHFYIYHLVQAYVEDSIVYSPIPLCSYHMLVMSLTSRTVYRGGEAPRYDVIPVTRYWKTEVELWPPTPTSTGVSSSAWPKVLSHSPWPLGTNLCVEHPHVHPDYESGVHKYDINTEKVKTATQDDASTVSSSGNAGAEESRYAFMSISNEVGLATAPQGWVRVDLWHGRDDVASDAPYDVHYLNTRQFSEEVVLVPKAPLKDSKTDTDSTSNLHPSARVWVLGMFFDAPSNRSALAVLDGETMQRQATIWLDHASPHGLHGSWLKPPPR